ncbi:hypothetical protein HY227_02110 [Candidatus Wolfebacteria bacterium]|nr:hypothetical protein [Candidatus Wolfebacteria bacterium]
MSNKKLADDFKKLIKKDKLSHAYLFFGGNEKDRENKFKFAESLANFLENGIFEPPQKMLIELLSISKNEGGTIGIDVVRAVKNFLFQKPIVSKYRVLIIKDSESLTTEAENAILKIVEEPPESSLIIFIARNEDNISRTLASRLQKIHFPASPENALSEKIADWKSFSFDDAILEENIDNFFESLIFDLKKDPIKNFRKIKGVLGRFVLIKRFNVNKKLQMRFLRFLIQA